MTAPWDTAEDRAFRKAERWNEIKRQRREAAKQAEAGGAKPAKGCHCEDRGHEPWLERDVDGQLHCSRCGRDYKP